MYALASRPTAEAPVPRIELETYLQHHLGYGVRKTLAKYLDEYNWYEAVGRRQEFDSTDRLQLSRSPCCCRSSSRCSSYRCAASSRRIASTQGRGRAPLA